MKKFTSVAFALMLIVVSLSSACRGTDPQSTPSTPLQAAYPSDPTSILRDYGPGSQALQEQGLDWATLAGIASVEVEAEGLIIHLAQGATGDGQEQAILAIIEPEPEAEGWRPRSVLAGPTRPTGPTFLTVTTPRGLVYLGFTGAGPPSVIEYDAEGGAVQSVQVNTSEGVVLLPDARKSDPRPRQSLG